MNRRLQKRCLITSAVVHGLLVLLLVVGPAFQSRHEDLLGPGITLNLVPGPLLDAALNEAPPAEPEAAPPARPTPPDPQPQPAPEPEPEPRRPSRPRPEPEPIALPTAPNPVVETRKAPPRETPKIDFSQARRLPDPSARKSDRAPARPPPSPTDTGERRLRDLSRSLERATASLGRSSQQSTVNVRIGGGGGGSANALYVRNAYNIAWVTPTDVTDHLATTEVEVVIRRDGTVVQSRILRRSGIASLDRSVESALKKVTRIQPFDPFPDPALEQVAFTIGFNLQAKGLL